MSDLDLDSSSLRRAGARIGAEVARRRTVLSVLGYALVAVLIALTAYPRILTGFGVVDDEGTLLVSLHSFINGETLYRDIYSPYGPFYFEFFGAFFSLTGIEVSTDSSRLITIAVWVLAAILSGVISQRLTGSLLIGLAASLASFGALEILVAEPMHPQGLNTLLLTGFTLLAVLRPRRDALAIAAAAAAGALLAALVLTKINVGAFAVAGVALAAVLAFEPFYRRRWIRFPVVLAFIAMPFLVMGRDLDADWVRSLIAIELMAAVAMVVAASAQRPRRGENEEGVGDWLIVASVSFVAAAGLILIVILLAGTSIADAWNGVIAEALQVRDALVLPFNFPPSIERIAVLSLAVAVVLAILRRRGRDAPSALLGCGRILVGLAIWLTIAQAGPLSFAPMSHNRLALALVLAWVAIVPPGGAVEGAHRRFARILVVGLAIAGSLQVYPVAGSQMGIAAAVFIPVGALCLGDGLAELRARSASIAVIPAGGFAAISTALLLLLVVKLSFGEALDPASYWRYVYRVQDELSVPGAKLVRLPPEESAKFERIVELLHENRCTNFIGYANTNSLYLWAGIDPPAPSAPGAWVTALNDETQSRIVAEMMATPRPCALINEGQANLWLAGKPRPETPLVEYIFSAFEPVETIGDYQFALPVASGRGGGS